MNEPVKVTYTIEDILKKIDEKLDKMEESSNRRFEKLESKLDTIQKDVDQKLDTLQKDVTDLKVGQAKLEEKVDGLGKRLDYQEFINRGVLIGFMVALLGGLAKMFGLIGNP